ncbi:MAG: HAMP domain-containing histidine kinase [Notoacmeibacter sp.]|nr:HAMP domain-containing histidine kinase [Notoacmeibacter sp.]MCC0033566.1 HAMP domain-containing histidine kinase [Brucellaceae bacterium]
MSKPQSRHTALVPAAAAVAARLAGATAHGPDFDRRTRLAAVAAVTPVIAVAAFACSAPGVMDVHTVTGASLVVIAVSVIVLATLNVSRSLALAGPAALMAAGVLVALLAMVSGGLAGPYAILLAAPAVEAWWVARSRAALLSGLAVSLAAAAFQLAVTHQMPGVPLALAALPPLMWIATLVLRLAHEAASASLAREGATQATDRAGLQEITLLDLAENGDVTAVSGHARTMLGLHPGLLLGSGLFDRIHIADRIAYLTAIADMRDGAARCRAPVRLRLPRDEARHAANPAHDFRPFALELVRSADGRIHAFMQGDEVAAALREELEAIRDEAAGVDMAKSRFLASVSHELRTPLNAIIGFADILHHEMFGTFQDPRQKEYAGLIASSGKHLLSVVNAILDVSKIESGTYAIHRHGFDFAEAVEMPLSIVSVQAREKGITLNLAVEDGVGDVNADRRAIQQILINLLSNAVKFTPENGTVTLGARCTSGRFTFWVNDSGIGIAPEDLKRLGQPFMQVQNDYTRHYEGTGLGLSLVKGLVKLHEGTMAIDSAPGEGTCVTVTLPDAASAAGTVVPLVAGTKGESDANLRKIA